MTYFENEDFLEIDYSDTPLPKGNYENCVFSNCHFAHSDLSDIKFLECTFKECDLSMANLHQTAFREVSFQNCKMLGLQFQDCNTLALALRFEECILNLSSFFGLDLKNTLFKSCLLQEVDLAQADLEAAIFEKCDLSNALFEGTNLKKADLRTAYNYIIDPELNRIKGARFSMDGLMGLLAKYDIEVE